MENGAKDLEEMTGTEIVKAGVKRGIKSTVRKPWFKRLITFLLIFCVGFGTGFYRRGKSVSASLTPDLSTFVVAPIPTEKPFLLTISHVEEIIKLASDMITTKYAYTDADTYENYKQLFNIKLPLTTNKVVFTYSGEIGIGIDLSEITAYLDNENKTITIDLPEVNVKYNEIDAESFEYYNVSSTIFNQLEMEDITDLIAALLEQKEAQVLNNKKIMEEAKGNTEIVLRSLLSNSDITKEYKVVFK